MEKLLTSKTRLDETGRVLVSAEIRKAMGLKPGDYVTLILEDDGSLHLMTTAQVVERAQRLLGLPVPYSLVDELLKDRREEVLREEGPTG